MVDELVVADKKGFWDKVPIVSALRRKARQHVLEDQKRKAEQDALVKSQARLLDEVNRLFQLLNGMTNSLQIPDVLDDLEAVEMPSASSGVELYKNYFAVLKAKHEAFLDYLHVLEGRKVEMSNRLVQFKEEVENLENFLGVLKSGRVQKIKDVLNYEMGVTTDSEVKARFRKKLGELAVIEGAIKSLNEDNDKLLRSIGDMLTQKYFDLYGLLGEIEKFNYENFFGEVAAFLEKVKAVHYDDFASDTENLDRLKESARELEQERKKLLEESKVVLDWVKKSRKSCVEAKALVEKELSKFKKFRRLYAVQRNKLLKFIKGLKKEALVANISHYAHIYDSMISLTEHFINLCEVYKRHENADVFYKDKLLNSGFPERVRQDNGVWRHPSTGIDVEEPFFNYRVKILDSLNVLEKVYDRRYLELAVADPDKADELKKVYDAIRGYLDLIVRDFVFRLAERLREIKRDYSVGRQVNSEHDKYYFRIANDKKNENLFFLDYRIMVENGWMTIIDLLEAFRDVLNSHRERFLKLLEE